MRYIRPMQNSTPRTAKIVDVMKTYALQCPYCEGDVANDEGSLEFRDNESHGQTGTCTVCFKDVALPKALRSEPRS